MLGNLALLAGLALLIWLALRGVNIIIASLLAAIVVALGNALPLTSALQEHYPFGPLGAFSFAGRFFILFLAGAMFGKLMAASQAANGIAMAIVRALGVRHTLLVTMLACALLTYGGVVVFVVIFTVYPLGISLMREAQLPKRLFCAAAALGAGTFTMTALPGTPSIHNVIAASALQTDLFAGAWIGILAAILMAGGGMWYLEWQWRRARVAGEGYVANEQDQRMAQLQPDGSTAPGFMISMTPLLVVLTAILLPRLLLLGGIAGGGDSAGAGLLQFAQTQPVLWSSFALMLGCLTAIGLFPILRKNTMQLLGRGAEDGVMPLINTAAVIGFGGVVTQTEGFRQFVAAITAWDLPPLLSAFASANVVSGIVGSSSGGLQIFMQTLAPRYLEMGIEPETLHRISAIASGGLDSLPHCGAVVAMLMIMGLSHREAYRDLCVVTLVIPLLAGLLCVGVLAL